MNSPFDTKNRVASLLDRLAVRTMIWIACVMYFFALWHHGIPSLIAGGALFVLVLLCLSLIEQRTLATRERILRERAGGMIAISDLIEMPTARASASVCALLCETLDAERLSDSAMVYGGETWLVRCVQCLQGSSVGEGDVLAAHRARIEAGLNKCVIVSTGGVSPAATRAGEWMDPPVRLIDGHQLARIAGRIHPATDAEMAGHVKRQRSPFSWTRIRALALSPVKLRRHLLCAFLLMMLYLVWPSLVVLIACLMSFVLAMLCARENRRRFVLS